MIILKKLSKDEIQVLYLAIKHYNETFFIMSAMDKQCKIIKSITEELKIMLFKKYTKAPFQDNFKLTMYLHQAIVLNTALSIFKDNVLAGFSKNVALKLIIKLDPQTV